MGVERIGAGCQVRGNVGVQIMPVTFSIQPIIDAQTTALTTTINAARDNVKADNTTQITSQNTALTATINAARDNVKADNVTQVTAQTTAINGNTDTKTAAVTAVVNTKGAVKSVQRGECNFTTGPLQAVTIAAVDVTKAVVHVSGLNTGAAGAVSFSGQINSATSIQVRNFTTSSSHVAQWQVVEYF